MDQDDRTLVARWRAGDRAVLAVIAERYTAALGAVAYGILGDASLCEDVVQETYARAAKSLHRLNHDGKLGGYLVGIARHVATDMVRVRSRETVISNAPESTSGLVYSTASLNELHLSLKSAVNSLPEDQRELFLMKYVSNMRYGEISRSLGISPTAVSQKLFRIRQKLQRELKDFHP